MCSIEEIPDSPNDSTYWKKRCFAAEKVIEEAVSREDTELVIHEIELNETAMIEAEEIIKIANTEAFKNWEEIKSKVENSE